jgi:tetratricopeptide (TPR) repeat protein
LALLKRLPEAEQDLRKALELQPDFLPARLNLGVAYWLDNQEEKALTEFEAVLQAPEEKRLLEAAYYRGQLYLKRRDYPKALADFDLVATEDPRFGYVHLLRSQVYLAQGQEAPALENLNAFLADGRPFDRHGAAAYELRGRLLRLFIPDLPPTQQIKCAELALLELANAYKLGGRSAELFDDLGAVLGKHLRRPDQALGVYSQGLEQAPKDTNLRNNRAWAYAEREQWDQAMADFAHVVRADPKNAEAQTGLGYVHAHQKAPEEAQRAALQALLHAPDDPLVFHTIACIYATLSQSDAGRATQYQDTAMDSLQRAVELWRRAGAGPNMIELIESDKAFPKSMRDRPDFQKLIKE